MKNWSVDEKSFEKRDSVGYKRWRLEQLINYGLDENEKINEKELREHWHQLTLDPARRRFMDLLLTGNVRSH